MGHTHHPADSYLRDVVSRMVDARGVRPAPSPARCVAADFDPAADTSDGEAFRDQYDVKHHEVSAISGVSHELQL